MKSRSMRGDITLSAAIVVVLSGSTTAMAEVPIYGGPTYVPSTITGFRFPIVPITPGSTAGDGVGVGHAEKHISGANYGYRAIRWNTLGHEELGLLGATSGYAISYAYATHADGTTVGTSDINIAGAGSGTRAVRWDAGTTIPTQLGHLGLSNNGWTGASAHAINAGGTIAGTVSTFSGGISRGYRAVRWDAGSLTATELGHIGIRSNGSTDIIAIALNNGNTLVGYGKKYTEELDRGHRAIRWDAGTTAAIELGNLGTGLNPFGGADNFTNSRAYAINAGGTVVGFANKYTGGSNLGTRAVRWDAGSTTATELGNLGTLAGGSTTSEAYAINDSGTVVGFAHKYVGGSTRGFRAVRWDAGSTIATELGILGTFGAGLSTSYAYAINNDGITVGFVRKHPTDGTPSSERAVYWGADGEAIDLNTLISPADASNWLLHRAIGISDTGWITGTGTFDPDGATGPLASYVRTFLLQISVPPSCATCAADYNQDGGIDGSDVDAFFTDWEQGANCADTNQDGGIDGTDVEAFFAVWEAGGC